MSLNKQSGNMYGFVTHTWNVIKGKCPHDCEYCYMKVFPQGEIRFDEKELKTDLGRNNFIFVGSSCDMFAEVIPKEWIVRVLDYCKKFPENTYLFQTKNPIRFTDLRDELISMNCILGTTIETNREGFSYNAPTISERIRGMEINGFRKMITIEPVIDFDVIPLISLIERTNPEFVNIGADSKNHNLPEPSAFKIENLIKELQKFTKSMSKKNLSRIQNGSKTDDESVSGPLIKGEEIIEKKYNEWVLSDKCNKEYFECFKAGYEKALTLQKEEHKKEFNKKVEGLKEEIMLRGLMSKNTMNEIFNKIFSKLAEEKNEKPKVVIINDNPVSLMGYAEEYPENFKKICDALDKNVKEKK